MGRGFFAGSLWGGVIGVITIALASQLIEWRDLTPDAPATAAMTEADDGSDSDAMASTEDASDATVEAEAGEAEALAETEEATPEPEADAQPEVVAEAPEAPAAESGDETADVVISNETIAENAGADATEAPALSEATTPDTAEVATPDTPDVPAQAPDIQVAAVDQITAPGEGDAPALSSASDTLPAVRDVPVTEAVEPDGPVQNGLEAPAAPETVAEPLPGPAPRPTGVGDAPEAPDAGEAPSTLAERDGLDTPTAQADTVIVAEAPPAPLPEEEPVVEAEPEPEPEPVAEVEEATSEDEAEVASAEAESAAVETETADAGAATDETEASTSEQMAETDETPTVEAAPAEVAESEPEETPAQEAEPIVVEVTPEPAAEPNPADDAETEIAAAPQATEELPRVLRIGEGNGNSLIERDSVTRLPGIGQSAAEPEETTAEPEVSEAEVTEGAMEELPEDALRRFAQDFDAPTDLPLMSVVLIHTGGDPGALSSLALPVSFAVDAGLPNATDIANAYRAAGREVVMIPSLPPRARPSDVEQALQINLQTIPEAVALMDSPDESFQGDRQAMAQVVEAAAVTGHGLLTFPRGLNSAQQLAARSAVPAGLIFRDLDRQNATRGAISRSLDQAVLRAGPETAVILVARTKRNTLDALRDWADGGRAASVALVPVSTALIGR